MPRQSGLSRWRAYVEVGSTQVEVLCMYDLHARHYSIELETPELGEEKEACYGRVWRLSQYG